MSKIIPFFNFRTNFIDFLFVVFGCGRNLVELGDGLVDAVEVAVAAALDGDLFLFLAPRGGQRERKR